MDKLPVTRRLVLAAIPALGTCAAAPSIAHLGIAAASPELQALVQAFQRAKAISDRYRRIVWEPLVERYTAAVDGVPHYVTETSYESMGHGRRHMSTAHGPDVATAKHFAGKPSEPAFNEHQRCRNELADAIGRRELQIADYRQSFCLDHCRTRTDHLDSQTWHALAEIEMFPASTLAEMIAKYDVMIEHEAEPNSVEDVLADLRRIAGKEV